MACKFSMLLCFFFVSIPANGKWRFGLDSVCTSLPILFRHCLSSFFFFSVSFSCCCCYFVWVFFLFCLRPIVIFKGYKNRWKYNNIQCSSHLTNIHHPTACHNNANNNNKFDATSAVFVVIETISHPIDNIRIRFKLRSLCYRWIPPFHFYTSSLSRRK